MWSPSLLWARRGKQKQQQVEGGFQMLLCGGQVGIFLLVQLFFFFGLFLWSFGNIKQNQSVCHTSQFPCKLFQTISVCFQKSKMFTLTFTSPSSSRSPNWGVDGAFHTHCAKISLRCVCLCSKLAGILKERCFAHAVTILFNMITKRRLQWNHQAAAAWDARSSWLFSLFPLVTSLSGAEWRLKVGCFHMYQSVFFYW